MDKTTDDRRIRRTKTLLRVALSKLLSQKELYQISVQELADTADIHRATFYAHYQNVFELYEEVENEVLDNISTRMKGSPGHDYKKMIASLLEIPRDNIDILRMLLGKNGSKSFQDRLCALLVEKYMEICRYETGLSPLPQQWMYLAGYQIHGWMYLVSTWIENDCEKPTKEQLVDYIYKLDNATDSLYMSYVKPEK